jgi:LPS-assembly protein
MRRRTLSTLLFGTALLTLSARPVAAQLLDRSECTTQFLRSDNPQQKRALRPDEPPDSPRPWFTSGNVQITCDEAQLFADEVEYYEETHVLKARGHVNFIDGDQRITADHLEFNTKTKLGTFYHAQGIMTIAAKPDPLSMFGATEADAYFYGEVLEKVGPVNYKLKNGHFTTCVQPTPRWEFEGSTVTMVKVRHAVKRNVIFRIKNVPVFYLPWFYYPINKDGRSTGFLMPSYGHSTIRGQMFSDAFFWAINRSQDATLNYEYSSKVGTGYGGEYLYIQAPGSEGTARLRILNGKDTTGSLLTSRSVDIVGSMTQRLPGNWQMRGNVNYTNKLVARQLFQQDISVSTNSTRYAGANVQGQVGKIRLTGEAAITDYFTGTIPGQRQGTAPRLTAEWPSAPIGRSRIYFGMVSDFTSVIRQQDLDDPTTNRNLLRFDAYPTLRTPIGSLPYLAATATVGFRFTYWNEQLDAQGIQVEDPLHRQLLDLRLDVTGPTFTRIFDTPGSGYATRWKHVVQPSVSVSRSTAFDSFSHVAVYDGIDTIQGGLTNITYGLANRLLAKRPSASGQAVAQEVASIRLQQTYFSNELGALYDTSIPGRGAPSKLGPLSLVARAQPSARFTTEANVNYNTKYKSVMQTSIGGGVQSRAVDGSVSWSKTFFVEGLEGYNDRARLANSLNTSATFRAPDNHLHGTWSWR